MVIESDGLVINKCENSVSELENKSETKHLNRSKKLLFKRNTENRSTRFIHLTTSHIQKEVHPSPVILNSK